MHFLVIFRYLQISFAVKSSCIDQVLTKTLQIDQNLTFDIFHILNQDRISKIEKTFIGTDPPQKKGIFLVGGYVSSYTFFNFGDTTLLQNMQNIKNKFLIDLQYFSQHFVNAKNF